MFGFGFKFLDPGPLIDEELTLVAPAARYVDELIHAETVSKSPDLATLRQRTFDFLQACPAGHQRGERLLGLGSASPWSAKVPSYHFWMRLDPGHPVSATVPIRIAGGMGVRIGHNDELEFFSGHIGYHVYPPARGHHYAERAVRLVLPLLKRHRVTPLWITANPDNVASRRTIERLGGEFIDVVDIPKDHPFYDRGERQKARYRFNL